mmetsp:Transcript_9049/g.12834  ORF Transcript_9049/g.12834 Transcript_9049/m.12834 type:complete len:587 (-) Transcript_9049:56-1816(-)
MADEDARYEAMVEFLGCFPTLSGAPPTEISELSDGVAMFEALSEIASDFFDPTTIARHLGDNWALKSSNLRKLLRNLEQYYHEGLGRDADFESVDVGAIAKDSDPEEIASLFELLAAAAVTCENKGEFVGRIMGMTPENQAEMKEIIQSSLGRLQEYDSPEDDEEEEEEEEENELVFGAATPGSSAPTPKNLFSRDHNHSGYEGTDDTQEIENALVDARRELAAFKSQASIADEENEAAQKKLRVLVEDLQDRLLKRQEELITAEEDLKAATVSLEDFKAKATELGEKNAQLADDLDVANAKAAQLRKAEATVMAYRNKLEGVGVMNQQMTDLEEQAASYLRQIMELEADTKKLPALQRTIQQLQDKVSRADKEKSDADAAVKTKAAEVADLKSKLSASDGAKKMYEEELNELRAHQEGGGDEDLATGVSGLSLASATSVTEAKEKAIRLEVENKKLKEDLEALKNAPAPSLPPIADGTTDVGALQGEVARLKDELSRKEAEKAKIGSDKEKLEAYTKKTLAKFQEKYLVALQECKAKLKEKQDKIEALEGRSSSEKTAQKREERLLSATIYELGLAIMQNRLKDR